MNIFEEANDVLNNFIINNLSSYHQLRNYDYGIKKRTNVSQILNIHLMECYTNTKSLKNEKSLIRNKNILMKFSGGSIGRVILKITNKYGLNI